MIRIFLLIIAMFPVLVLGQSHYEISFIESNHHIAQIQAEFKGLSDEKIQIRMSRTSPGRYAIHNFAKNVFDVSAFNEKGEELEITRSNPQQWDVTGHDIQLSYGLPVFSWA